MTKKTILGLSGSIRSNLEHGRELSEYISSAVSLDDLKNKFASSDCRFSNSDIALSFALLGARMNDFDFNIYSIPNIFKISGSLNMQYEGPSEHYDRVAGIDFLALDDDNVSKLFRAVEESSGIILSTPVYFGDRSSVANKFMQITNKHKLLHNKVFGMIASGAKRNGGQETTCIYGLYDALTQDSLVVGNGPKTSQYGGTVFAGDLHTAFNDEFGVQTSWALGHRMAYVSEIINEGQRKHRAKKLKIKVLMTMDTPEKYYSRFVHEYFSRYLPDHDFEIINLIDYTIFRCYACKVCPSPKYRLGGPGESEPYCCAIRSPEDSMKYIQEILLDNDGLVIVGVNSLKEIIYRYQVLVERTRFIRRDDFQLTNTPIIGLLINEVGGTNHPLHNLKVLTSYIRHNTIILKPIEITIANDRVVHEPPFEEYIPLLQRISLGREMVGPRKIGYSAHGYADRRLDKTFKYRK